MKRLVYSAIFITITCFAIFAAPAWLFWIVVVAFAIQGLREYLGIVEKRGVKIHWPAAMAGGALIPLAMLEGFEVPVIFLATLGLFVVHFSPQWKQQSLSGTGLVVFGWIYVVWSLAHLIPLRGFPEDGHRWVFYVILLVKGGDAGAYFVGTRMGKKKLIEHISPNKSVEGAWGGLVTCVALSLISKAYLPGVPIGHLLLLGLLLGVISQLGDLAESLIKREVGVKDSGQVPGLGGILDVLDSLLFTIPVTYYYVKFFISVPWIP